MWKFVFKVHKALFIIAKKWKPCKCPGTERVWFIRTVGYYSAIEWSETLVWGRAWMTFENMLHERNQSQATYSMIPFIVKVQNRQILRNSKHVNSCQRAGKTGNGEELLRGFFSDENFLDLMLAVVAQLCEYTKKKKNSEFYTLKKWNLWQVDCISVLKNLDRLGFRSWLCYLQAVWPCVSYLPLCVSFSLSVKWSFREYLFLKVIMSIKWVNSKYLAGSWHKVTAFIRNLVVSIC